MSIWNRHSFVNHELRKPKNLTQYTRMKQSWRALANHGSHRNRQRSDYYRNMPGHPNNSWVQERSENWAGELNRFAWGDILQACSSWSLRRKNADFWNSISGQLQERFCHAPPKWSYCDFIRTDAQKFIRSNGFSKRAKSKTPKQQKQR